MGTYPSLNGQLPALFEQKYWALAKDYWYRTALLFSPLMFAIFFANYTLLYKTCQGTGCKLSSYGITLDSAPTFHQLNRDQSYDAALRQQF